MGKILNTTYHDTVEQLTSFNNSLINNPFYVLNDKKPVICTYYNINKTYSSLDQGSKLNMDNIGSDCPIKYNKIEDFIIYGFNRIELNNSRDEFGTEAERIEGECYILPNSIVPYEGDYFEVDHIKDSTWLFIVKDVQKDTLENGSNAFKISYRLEYVNHDDILNNIVYNFRMIEEQEGTNISKIVRCEDYDVAKKMDDISVMLKKYYSDLFYSKKVQTFIFSDLTEYRVYDQFMIEFLIRNKVLNNGAEKYIYVTHQIKVPETFTIDYDRTFFRIFEKNKREKLLSSQYTNYLQKITSYGTTFSARYEDYFKAIYEDNIRPGYNTPCLDEDLLYNITDVKYYVHDEDLWKNIFVKYFNNFEDLSEKELESVEDYTFKSSVEAFYCIPLLIFCLEKYIEKVLK